MPGSSASEPRFHVHDVPEGGGRELWPPSIPGAQKGLSLGWAHMTHPCLLTSKQGAQTVSRRRELWSACRILLLLQQTKLWCSVTPSAGTGVSGISHLILNYAIWQIIKGCSMIVITEFGFPTFNSFQIVYLVIIITINFSQLHAKCLLTDNIFHVQESLAW